MTAAFLKGAPAASSCDGGCAYCKDSDKEKTPDIKTCSSDTEEIVYYASATGKYLSKKLSSLELHRAVFLDLNGTFVLPLRQESLSEMKLIPHADSAVAELIEHKWICPVVTVQSGIAWGRFTESGFRTWFHDFFSQLRLDVKGPYICPHGFSDPCLCKKPNSLLYEQAASEYSIDLSKSYVVGDTLLDVIAGKKMGGAGCLVRTGWGMTESEYQKARQDASYIGESLGDVVNWILHSQEP